MVMAPSAVIDYQESINFGNKVNYIDGRHGDNEIAATGLASESLIQKVLKERIAHIDVDTCEPGEEDAFYVADLGEVYRQHLRWKMKLARVKPFYGMYRCSPKSKHYLTWF